MIVWIVGFIIVFLSAMVGFYFGVVLTDNKSYDEGRRHEHERLIEHGESDR